MTDARSARPGTGRLAIVGALLIALAAAAPAAAQMSSRNGADLLRAVEDGERDCGDLSRGDFEAVGEHVMERMVGSAAAHESMDEAMDRMMGRSATRAMHESLGRRFTDCGGGELAGTAGIMGMMGLGASPGGAVDPGFMMGDRYGARYDRDGDGWSTAATVMTALMAVLIGLAAVAVWRLAPRTRPGGKSALEVLDRRFAAGEVDADDYARRRRALEQAP